MSESTALLTIGQVVAQLKHEFPDLSITKIRYLESRSLLEPERSPGRYRKYSPAEIERLRRVLTLQRDEFLPLEVIRQRMNIANDPPTMSSESLESNATSIRSTSVLKKEEPIHTWEEASEAAGVEEEFLHMLVEFRLINRPIQSGPAYTKFELEIARICHLLARFGLEPRNLRLLVSSIEREASLVEQLTTPSLCSTHLDKREYGEKMLEDLAALLSQLLHLLLYKELQKLL